MRTFFRSAVATFFVVSLCIGCGRNGSPTAPPLTQPPPNATSGYVWGHVVNDQGQCLVDAAVEIVAGTHTGQKVVQQEVCSVWEDSVGFEFRDLPVGATITLRATKEGYQPRELATAAVTSGQGLDIVLVKE